MKPRMKTGVVPIKTFLVVGGKKSWQKKIWLSNSQIATTWLLLALCYNNFCNSWGEKSIEKNQSVLCTFVVYFKILQFFPDCQIKKHYIFLFFFQSEISLLYFYSIYFQFTFISNHYFFFQWITKDSASIYLLFILFIRFVNLKLLLSLYFHIHCFFLSVNHKID